MLPSNKKIAILVYTLGILIGMNLGLVQPYLPIILKEVGQFNISFVSTLMTIVSVVQMLSSLFFRNKKMNQRPNIFFLIIELVIFIIFTFTGVMDLRHMIIIPVFLFAILITGFQIVREIMEYTMFPAEELTLYLGIVQSSVLVGDSVGGPVGGYLYNLSISMLFIVFAILNLIIGIGYTIIYSIHSKYNKRIALSQEIDHTLTK
ncbi:MFS transporter [Heyndrickxia coagulans]|uniref:MFS transporter n=1 Tax=Heyndrickxia coagulans TaxID=1398 RepID=UPI0022862C42|nr:MFS transporter [Heyndrickxia coagulans]